MVTDGKKAKSINKWASAALKHQRGGNNIYAEETQTVYFYDTWN